MMLAKKYRRFKETNETNYIYNKAFGAGDMHIATL